MHIVSRSTPSSPVRTVQTLGMQDTVNREVMQELETYGIQNTVRVPGIIVYLPKRHIIVPMPHTK